ncbi:hypothetical protein H9L39_18913 [Fusarium oxysporum f. sp. albedinis]|nr:hypothetical protein H9L39_18913 [Fusarium oxysporum f. sp. albedinis]
MGDEQLQTNIDTCHQIVQDSSKLFTTPLQEPWTSPKTPYGLHEALTNLQSKEPLATCQEQAKRETERIFLKAGFQAWLAYFLTNRNQAYHHVGQTSSHQTLEAFHRLSADDRAKVATRVAGIKCHETVNQLLQKLRNSRKRKSKLLCTLDEVCSDIMGRGHKRNSEHRVCWLCDKFHDVEPAAC